MHEKKKGCRPETTGRNKKQNIMTLTEYDQYDISTAW
jgi:hypothetical protein